MSMIVSRVMPGRTGAGTAGPAPGWSSSSAARDGREQDAVLHQKDVAHRSAREVIGDGEPHRLARPDRGGRLKRREARPVVQRLVPLERVQRVQAGVRDGDRHTIFKERLGIRRRRLSVDEDGRWDRSLTCLRWAGSETRSTMTRPTRPAGQGESDSRVGEFVLLDGQKGRVNERLDVQLVRQAQGFRRTLQAQHVIARAKDHRVPREHRLKDPDGVLKPRIERADPRPPREV